MSHDGQELNSSTTPSFPADGAGDASLNGRRRRLIVAVVGAFGLAAVGAAVVADQDGGQPSASTATEASTTLAPVSTTRQPASTTTTRPAAAATTAPSVPTTSVAAPTTPVAARGAALEACSPDGACTFSSMNDGRLVRLDSRLKNDELPAFTIYGDNAATTGFFPESFEPFAPFLLDVGPGDIAYIWWIPRDEAETARVSAFELTGPDAGRLVKHFDQRLDVSGDTELVPTPHGFVTLGCCDVSPIRPSPASEVVIPWVDSDGAEIIADDRTHFVVEVNERLVVTADRPGAGEDQSWGTFFGDVAPRGMPFLWELDDGRVVIITDGAEATSDPVYLHPDGSVDVGESPGAVTHVQPDGRFIVADAAGALFITEPLIAAPAAAQGEALRGRPLVAIDVAGDAVVFPDGDVTPVLLYDGAEPADASTVGNGPNGVNKVSVAADLSVAYVGLCCAPVVGTMLSTRPPEVAAPTDDPLYGFAPTLNPSAALLAATTHDAVSVTDIATGATQSGNAGAAGWDTAHDLMWLDDDTLAVLGNQSRWWSLTIVELTGGVVDIGPTRPFANFDEFGAMQFAGVATDGQIAVHDVGTDRVLSGALDDFGNHNGGRGTALRVMRIPGPAQSAWYTNPEQLVWVDSAGALRVGGDVIPGEYRWARR